MTVAVINTYLAKATADYSTKNDKVTLNVYGIKKATGSDEFVRMLTTRRFPSLSTARTLLLLRT